jgi:hypothetical protein
MERARVYHAGIYHDAVLREIDRLLTRVRAGIANGAREGAVSSNRG